MPSLRAEFKRRGADGHLWLSKDEVNGMYQGMKDLMPNQLQRKYPFLEESESATVLYTLVFCRALLESISTDNGLCMIPSDIGNALAMYQFKQTKFDRLTRTGLRNPGMPARRKRRPDTVSICVMRKRPSIMRCVSSIRLRNVIPSSSGNAICSGSARLLAEAGQFTIGEEDKGCGQRISDQQDGDSRPHGQRAFLCARICAHTADPAYIGIPTDEDLTENEQLTQRSAYGGGAEARPEAVDAGRKRR